MTGEPKPCHVSVVVIGRNEGERLRRCLDSIRAADWRHMRYELIYVDSASSDGSAACAARAGARVLQAAGAHRNAAAGRNAGWRAARADTVLFLDGDTVLDPGFALRALAALDTGPYAAVWGHRREIAPRQSVYTAVLDLDWIYAPGETDYCGGDALFLRAALAQAGGFDETFDAGEEPELCRRLRAHGWRILHIDAPMTLHDLAISRFGQYWQRALRAGHAYAQVSSRYAGSRDPLWRREARRNRVHGTLVATAPFAWAAVLAIAPLVASVLAVLGVAIWLRSAARAYWKARGWKLALLYAAHAHAQQVPILVGQWRYWRSSRTGRAAATPQYKDSTVEPANREAS
ncbi:glycosyltransferase [Burkholderia sp. BCC1644]|uniref:glycosyltransferase n=1 Tax=Burkholderia sp. BCC1644 TaxID=2676293 RepID=UPI0015926402|nr:glycosyltransferase [Burkholderia sp. BCC1644]